MGTLTRYSPTQSTQSCAATGSYGSAATWSNSSSPSGPAAVQCHDPRQRARAVVSAAASSLRCVVVPRLERARALLAAAVLARTQLADRLRRAASVERREFTGCRYHDGRHPGVADRR